MLTRLIYMAGVALCALLLLGATQCQSSSTSGVGTDGPVFVTTLAVEDANGNAVDSFAQGQAVQFVLSVRNRSNSSQTLAFNTVQLFNMVVLDSGTATEVWSWSQGQSFSPNSSSLTVKAGQTQTFTVTWNQTGDNGQLLPVGNYEVIGGLTCASSGSASGSSASIACMPSGLPTSDQLAPSVYISTLVPFTIR